MNGIFLLPRRRSKITDGKVGANDRRPVSNAERVAAASRPTDRRTADKESLKQPATVIYKVVLFIHVTAANVIFLS